MMKVLAILAVVLSGLSHALAAQPVPSDGVITSSGEYFLTANRTSTGTYNIQINANNVDLDLRGFTVTCNPSNPAAATTFGIFANSRDYITIRNGKVTGCYMGIQAGSTTNNLRIRGVDFTGNTYIGINAGGRHTEISDSVFADIGGYSPEAYAIGINNPGTQCVVERNVFRNLHRQSGAVTSLVGEGVGILFSSESSNCTARHNWLENDELGAGHDIAFWVGEAMNITISENTVTNFGWGIAAVSVTAIDNRFWMRNAEPGSFAVSGDHGSASGNTILGYDEAISGSIPAQDNLILP